jgi:hypothetical protein
VVRAALPIPRSLHVETLLLADDGLTILASSAATGVRSAGSPQTGQRTPVAAETARIVPPPSPRRSASTWSDGGIRREAATTMGHLRRRGRPDG